MRINELLEDTATNEALLSRLGSKLISRNARRVGGNAVGAIKGSTAALAEGAGDAVKLLSTLGLWFPFQQYFENMGNADDLLAAGQMTADEYEEQHRNQLGLLISTLAAALVGSVVIKSAEAFLSLVKVVPVIGKPLAILVGGMGNLAQLYFIKELVSDEGRRMLASLLSAGVLKGIGYVGLEAFPFFKKLVASAVEKAETETAKVGDTAKDIAKDPSTLIKQPHDTPAATSTQTPLAEPKAEPKVAPTSTEPTAPTKASADKAPAKTSGFAPIGMKRDAQGNLVIDPDA